MRLRLCSRGDVLDGEEDKVSATLAKELARIEQHGPLTKGLVTGYDAMIGSPGVPDGFADQKAGRHRRLDRRHAGGLR